MIFFIQYYYNSKLKQTLQYCYACKNYVKSFINRQLIELFDSVYVILLSDKWLSDWSQKLQIADDLSLEKCVQCYLKDNITNGKSQTRKQFKTTYIFF